VYENNLKIRQGNSKVVEVDGMKSTLRSLSSGVPQGCIPSPLCLSMICVLVFVFQSFISMLMIQIYLSGDRKDLDEMISALNEDLAAIYRWSAEKGLLLNLHKLQTILISNSAEGMVLPSLFLGTDEIPWCDAVTDLGVVIDGRFRFDRQFTKVCSRVYATLHRLRLLKFLTPNRVRLQLCEGVKPCFFRNSSTVILFFRISPP
jgi:hypothetical protein